MYQDNDHKFVAVLNQRHPLPVQLNAFGHLTAGLAGAQLGGGADYVDYPCPAGGFSSRLSRFPFIVAAAKNSNQLRTLCEAATAAEIAHNVFVTAMLGASSDDQQRATASAQSEDLDFVAVVLFG